MKCNPPLLCLGVALTLLAGCEGKPDAADQARQLRDLQGKIAEIASQANRAASAAVDPDTRLDGATAGPGLKLTTRYTLVNAAANGVDPTSFETRTAPVVRQGTCANSALRPLIDQGVVVVLEYRDLKGNPLGSVSVNRETCGALK